MELDSTIYIESNMKLVLRTNFEVSYLKGHIDYLYTYPLDNLLRKSLSYSLIHRV